MAFRANSKRSKVIVEKTKKKKKKKGKREKV